MQTALKGILPHIKLILATRSAITPGSPKTPEIPSVIGLTARVKLVTAESRLTAKRQAIPEADEIRAHLKKCLLLSMNMSIIIAKIIQTAIILLHSTTKTNPPF